MFLKHGIDQRLTRRKNLMSCWKEMVMKYLFGLITRRGCGCVLLALVTLACAGLSLYGAVQLAERLFYVAPR
jgi:hypothetical protein